MAVKKSSEQAVIEILGLDEVRGRILRDTAFLDFSIGILIGMYFTTEERFMNFHKFIVERMTFKNKIDVLAGILKGKSYKSANVIVGLQKFKKLRNHLAHVHFVHGRQKLFRDKEIERLLLDWPGSYKKEYENIKQKLRRLGQTKEFLVISGLPPLQ